LQRQHRLASLIRSQKRLTQRIKARQQQVDQLANWRLIVLGGGGLASIMAAIQASTSLGWIVFGISVVIFAGVVVVHRRYAISLRKYKIWQTLKNQHIARIQADRSSLPHVKITKNAQHPYEQDIDLPDLHRLLNTASSQDGSQRLYDWLLNGTPNSNDIKQRQARIKDLIPMSTFRDKLTLSAELASDLNRREWDGQRLVDWLTQNTDQNLRPAFYLLSILSLINIVLFTLFMLEVLPAFWLATWTLYAFLFLRQWSAIASLFEDALQLTDALRRLTAVLRFIETYRYGDKPTIRELCQPIIAAKPSEQLRGLSWTVAGASLRQNPILYPLLIATVPWDMLIAMRLQRHKKTLATQIPDWLNIWAELEALSALANFAYCNPDYIFPDLQSDHVFEVTELGHPLLPHEVKISNDFTFDALGQVVIITGSNMSGKSSFLRTLGINLVLAYAGTVVNAQTFKAGYFRLFSSIRVTDSLDDGISFFYAEVKRLRALLNALEDGAEHPLFFLIDEIFRGTNNKERLIGSRAYTQAVAGQHGVGLIATHDLELVHLEDESKWIQNYHFREDIQDGRMVFDYTIRAGASPTTNALKIMALEGLPVDGV